MDIAVFTVITIVIAGVVPISVYCYRKRSKGRLATASEVRETAETLDVLAGVNPQETSNIKAGVDLNAKLTKATDNAREPELGELNLAVGDWHYNKGELSKAEKYYSAAHSYFTKASDRFRLARSLAGLATVYAANGHHEKAITAAQQALTITDEPRIHSEAKLRVGICYRRMNNFAEAHLVLNESLKIAESLHDTALTAEIFIAIGDIFWKKEQWLIAEDTYKRSIKILSPDDSLPPKNELSLFHLSQAKYAIGRVCIANQRFDEAERLLSDSFNTLERIGRFYGIEMCAQLLGNLYETINDQVGGRHWYNESLVATMMTGNDMRRIDTLYFISQLSYDSNLPLRAEILIRKGLSDTLIELFPETSAKLLMLSGDLFSDAFYPGKAIESYETAILCALRAGPSAVSDTFIRLSDRLKRIADDGNKALASRIIQELAEWWPIAQIDERRAIDVENEVLHNASAEDSIKISKHIEHLLVSLAN